MKYFLYLLFSLLLSPCFGQKHHNPEFFKSDPLINKKGVLAIPVSYLKSVVFESGLVRITIKDTVGGNEQIRFGFVNSKGKFEIPPQYLKTEKISHEILALQNENLHWEFYKKESGLIKTTIDFDDYKIVSSGFILVSAKNRWGILMIDKKQNKLIQPVYKNIEHVSGNKFKLYHFKSWQLTNKDKKILHEYSYDSLFFIQEDLLKYKLNSACGIIDFEGNVVLDSLESKKVSPLYIAKNSEPAKIIVSHKLRTENNKYGISDSTGKIIIPCRYDSIAGPYENIFLVYVKGKMGIIDDKGILVSEPEKKLEKVFPYVEGRAKFIKNGQYGFIDLRGSVRVAPQYIHARDYKEGLAAVTINGKWGFIDKDENIIIQPLYQEVSDFREGMARVKVQGKWHLINNHDRMVENAYDEIKESENNKWLIIKNQKSGLADGTGKELLAPRYKYLKDLQNGWVIVQKGEKWGVLDYNENFVFPIEYDFVSYNSEKELFLVMKKGKEEEIEVSFSNNY